MEPDLWASLAVLLLLVALMAVTSAAHGAWPKLGRGRLRHLAGEGSTEARSLLGLAEDTVSPHTTLTMANAAFVAIAAGIGATTDAFSLGGNPPALYAAAIAGIVVILWVQLVSHAVGLLHSEATVFALVRPLQVIHVLMKPVAIALQRITRRLVSLDVHQALEGGPQTDEEFRMIVDAVEEEGSLEEEERDMIHGIFEMGERTAREIMVPRVDVGAVEAGAPLRSVLDEIKERGHSRIPIYDETIDNIVGIVYAKDLLRHMEAGSLDDPAQTLARPPHFIPESKKIDELLREMQRDKVHIAVVLDEYGGTAGVITIEDLLEEIVGEIQDEYDAEEKTVERLNDHEAVVDARVSIRDVNDVLDLSLEEAEYDTVGGLVYDRLGKIPVVGDELKFDGLWLTVLSTSGKRIRKVKIQVEPDPAPEQSYSG